MKTTRLLPLLLACCILPAQAADAPAAPAPAPAAADKPLAIVNGEAVPGIYADFIRQNRTKRNMPPDSLSDASIRDGAVTAVLLAQDAVKKGLDKLPDVAAALQFQRMELLGRAAIEEYLRGHPISEEQIKAEYNTAKAKTGESEYRVRHILVKTEKEAQDAIAKLTTGKKKARFEDLAKKISLDAGDNGGDLGWVVPGNLVQEFATAMVGLKNGQITPTPVKTRFGWHVLRLEDTRKIDFPELDKVKNRIAGQLQQQQIGKLVRELSATAKVE